MSDGGRNGISAIAILHAAEGIIFRQASGSAPEPGTSSRLSGISRPRTLGDGRINPGLCHGHASIRGDADGDIACVGGQVVNHPIMALSLTGGG